MIIGGFGCGDFARIGKNLRVGGMFPVKPVSAPAAGPEFHRNPDWVPSFVGGKPVNDRKPINRPPGPEE